MRRKGQTTIAARGAYLLESVAIALAGLTAVVSRLDVDRRATCTAATPIPVVARAARVDLRAVQDPVLQDMLLHD